MKSRLLALSFAALTIGIGLSAQTASAADSADTSDAPHAMQQRRFDPAKFKASVEKRLDRLHSQLKLTADQEPAWASYRSDSLARLDSFASNRPDWSAMEDATAVARLEQMLARVQQHEKILTQQLDSTRSFYAKLNSEQQKVFDAETRMEPRGRGPHRGRPAGSGPR
ncbi:MAG: Spy/CpxP family protein refolding chaperone [Betaproteobacteria bacterium]|nr:Spy/CpxP family protein refolding chaperone [Betaproteobacteria bacterium]